MSNIQLVPGWQWTMASALSIAFSTIAMTGTTAHMEAPSVAKGLAQSAPAIKSPESESTLAKAWKLLTDAVGDEKAGKRAEATTALATIGRRPEVIRLVEERLMDKDAEVRQIAATSLGTMHSRASIAKLQRALDDDSADVSFAAAQALWELGDRSGRVILFEVLGAERRPMKEAVGSQLKKARKTLRNPGTLGLIGAKQVAEILVGPFALGIVAAEELAKDRSAPARALAASLLASDQDPQSARELEDALKDKNWVVRAAAAKALGARGSRQSLAPLAQLLEDEKEVVRFTAAAAIVRLSRQVTPLKSL